MSLDITLLQLVKRREKYEQLHRAVPIKALDPRAQILFADFGAYFAEFPDAVSIEAGPFMLWFKGFRHPTLKDDAAAIFTKVMQDIAAKDVPPHVEAGLMGRLVSADVAQRLVSIIEQYNNGEEIDLFAAVRAETDRFEESLNRKVKSPEVKDSIEDLLAAEENDTGFHWRMKCLDRHIKPLRPGDFGVIAARPDKGKTSLCASELTFFATQLATLYPGEYRPILWLNNEGPGRNILIRCYQAALGATTEDLARKSKAGTLRSEYAEALGNDQNLRVFNIHSMWNYEVEDLIRLHNPGLVLFDMVDNIKFGGDVNNNGQRTDQLLEAMYQWARVLAVKHNCAVLATSQISADGDGMQWPTLSMLKDSKTGKQGAADVIITMGTVNDPMMAASRYMGTTKNKRKRSGVPGSPMMEVIADLDRCRFVEMGE